MSEFEHPPYGDHIPVPGPAEHLDSLTGVAPATAAAAVTDGLPPEEPPRRTRRTLVAATLGVLLVLLVGGAAYGWSILQRPEVQLARAFDATKSASDGSMTVTVKAAGAAGPKFREMAGSSLRYAWGPGTQQFTVVYDGKSIGTVTTTATHVTVQLDPSALPDGDRLADSLGEMGGLAGMLGGADVVTALLDGKPVGIAVGPGSALQKALEKAQQSSGATSAPAVSPEEVAKVVASVTDAVKANATVTEAGSDADGIHYVATVPLRKVVDAAWKDVAALVPVGVAGIKPDLAGLEDATLSADVWVKDGVVTRIEVPLGEAMKDAGTHTPQGDVRLVVEMSGEGVTPVQGTVTEVPDSLIEMLTGNA